MPPARATAASSSSVFVPLRSPFGRFLSRRGRALSSLASVVAASVQRAPSGHPPLANGPFFTAMSTNEVNMTSLDPPTPIEGARAVDASPPRRRVRRSRRMRLSGRRGREGLGLANVILCIYIYDLTTYVSSHDRRRWMRARDDGRTDDATRRRGPRWRRRSRWRRAGDGRWWRLEAFVGRRRARGRRSSARSAWEDDSTVRHRRRVSGGGRVVDVAGWRSRGRRRRRRNRTRS